MFATFMYVVNKGQFSSMMTLAVFYANLAVLIIFNIIVNNNTNYKSAKTWIGKGQKLTDKVKKLKYVLSRTVHTLTFFHLVLEILLNSWSSVLSYNHFNFSPIFSKK